MRNREARYQALRAGIARPRAIQPDAVMRVLRVPPELAGTRLDRFVQGQLRDTSRTRSQLIIDNSAFDVTGARLKKNHRVQAEERIVLWRPPWDEIAPPITLELVYEDQAVIALNKPPLIPVHPTARYHRSTITMLIGEQRPDEHLTLLHRLDRETSGALLMARTREADRLVKIQFEQRERVLKEYLAITWGWPDWDHCRSDAPLEPDPVSPYRVKIRVAAAGHGLAAATSFETLERRRHPEDPTRKYALLRCTLHSGRQHQIRVHLSALGIPVVGDKLYGPDEDLFARGADGELTEEDRDLLELDRQALHAHILEMDHPDGGKRLRVEAPLYPDLEAFWARLKPA